MNSKIDSSIQKTKVPKNKSVLKLISVAIIALVIGFGIGYVALLPQVNSLRSQLNLLNEALDTTYIDYVLSHSHNDTECDSLKANRDIL